MAKASKALGGDLVIPALALGFTLYFFSSTSELVWEAKANGVVIGVVLAILVAVQLGRIAVSVLRGEGDLTFHAILEPRRFLGPRIALVLVTTVFIAVLPWLGLTLSLWLGMLAALYLVGVRSRAVLLWLPLATAASVYGLFIALLDAGFPHGPLEMALGALLR